MVMWRDWVIVSRRWRSGGDDYVVEVEGGKSDSVEDEKEKQ